MARNAFSSKKKTERDYYALLLTVSTKIGEIIAETYDTDSPASLAKVTRALNKYSNTLDSWAKKVATKVVSDMNRNNLLSWSSISERMSQEFAKGYRAKDGAFKVAKKLQNEQVKLIKTLPRKAAAHVQKLSREYLTTGIRHEVLAAKVQETTHLVKFRAACIARTEVAKAQTALTKARATSIGIKHYRWRTMQDGIVRDLHKPLEGKVFEFGKPPLVGREGRHGPGDFPNCRCYAEPIVEEATIYAKDTNSTKDK